MSELTYQLHMSIVCWHRSKGTRPLGCSSAVSTSPCFCPASLEGRGTRGSSQLEEAGLSCGVSHPPTRDSATWVTTVTVLTVPMTTPVRTFADSKTAITLCSVCLCCLVFWLHSMVRLTNIEFLCWSRSIRRSPKLDPLLYLTLDEQMHYLFVILSVVLLMEWYPITIISIAYLEVYIV